MLLFYCTFEKSLKKIAKEGLTSDGEPFVLHNTLEQAAATCRAPDGRKGHILVLESSRLAPARVHPPTAHHIAPHAILNAKPYRPPLAIEAAGGYVVRRTKKGNLKVLVIFRHGVWDLPKGKLDPGESPEQGAIREVSEEVGIKKKHLTLLQPLGVSIHGYVLPRKRRYAVKTTHWYAMETHKRDFTPQKKEKIEAVAWMSWKKAKKRLGYNSLRQHISALDPEALGLAQETA
ncbi:MAG: NUDIX hydrolase [Rubricoccaceae bacterium]|nr:NUDIX hydrolase [Rubricoccaceae bacterium]